MADDVFGFETPSNYTLVGNGITIGTDGTGARSGTNYLDRDNVDNEDAVAQFDQSNVVEFAELDVYYRPANNGDFWNVGVGWRVQSDNTGIYAAVATENGASRFRIYDGAFGSNTYELDVSVANTTLPTGSFSLFTFRMEESNTDVTVSVSGPNTISYSHTFTPTTTGSGILATGQAASGNVGNNNYFDDVGVTYLGKPGTVTGLLVQGHDATSVSLSWDSEPDSTSYNVYYSTSSPVTTSDPIGAEPTTASATVGSLTDATSYNFAVEGENNAGTSQELSNEVSQQTDLRATTPTLDTATEDEIGVSWAKVDTNPEGTWEIYVSEDGTLGTADVTGLSAGTSSHTITGQEDGEQYHVTLRRVVNGLQADSQVADTTLLPAPSQLTLDTTTDRELGVTWVLNDDSPDGSVKVYLSTDGSLGTLEQTLSASATSTTLSNLLDGEEYYVTIRRETNHAISDTQQSAVTNLPAPTNLALSTISDESADLSWIDNHNNGQTRVEFKRSSDATWTVASTLAIGVETETLAGLLNGELYDARVVATTEHADTVDN